MDQILMTDTSEAKEPIECKTVAVEVNFAIDDVGKFADTTEDFIGASVKNRTTEIVVKHLAPEELTKVREAKNNEIDQWMRYKIVHATSSSGLTKRQLMHIRWIFTKKSKGVFKARLVLLEYRATNPSQVPMASPTCSRRARQIFSTMSSRLGYKVTKGDVKNAFTQGNDYEDELYTEPVEELHRALKMSPAQCVQLKKAIDGLPEAPHYL
jgi:hypothetical protein